MARVRARPWQPCRSIYVLVCMMFGLCECNSLSTWNCSDAALAMPIRVIQCGTPGAKQLCPDASIAAGFGFYALDAYSGSYGGLFTIPAASAGGVLSQVSRNMPPVMQDSDNNKYRPWSETQRKGEREKKQKCQRQGDREREGKDICGNAETDQSSG